jgi:6-phosphogluconolactonase (cycloisomerase 2 family)
VYVTNSSSRNISTFAVDVTTGQPTLTGDLVKADQGVRQMAFTPDARTAYASDAGSGTISVYSVGAGGQLTELPGDAGSVSSGGDTPVGIVVRPDGHTLYIAHVDSASVTAFTINSDGTLTPLRTATASVADPRGLAVTPDGRFLYVGHGDHTSIGAITAFAINADGTLTSIGSPIKAGGFCGALAITPDGHHLYLTCSDSDGIYGYAIGSDGALTPLPHSPYAVSDYPEAIATSPDGRFVSIASVGLGTQPPGPGAVSNFSIGSDGALTPVPNSSHPFEGSTGITILPNGKFVYASGGVPQGKLDASGIDAAGTLQPLPGTPFPTGGQGPGFSSASVLPNQGPAAGFSTGLTTSLDGRSVTFDASASTDADGHVARYQWDFGDGTTQTTDIPQTTHAYPHAGTFQATLTVTDNEGCSTAMVSTGQAVLCNGTAAATTTHNIVVRG